MAKYSNTKAKINEKITTNGAQAVTGIILNDVLQTMVDSLGADYQFGGLVQPGSSFTAGEQPVVFLATTPGTYTNFGGLVVADGEVALLVWSGSAWSKQTPDIATRTEVGQLGQQMQQITPWTNNLVVNKIIKEIYVDGDLSQYTYYSIWISYNSTTGNIQLLLGGSNSTEGNPTTVFNETKKLKTTDWTQKRGTSDISVRLVFDIEEIELYTGEPHYFEWATFNLDYAKDISQSAYLKSYLDNQALVKQWTNNVALNDIISELKISGDLSTYAYYFIWVSYNSSNDSVTVLLGGSNSLTGNPTSLFTKINSLISDWTIPFGNQEITASLILNRNRIKKYSGTPFYFDWGKLDFSVVGDKGNSPYIFSTQKGNCVAVNKVINVAYDTVSPSTGYPAYYGKYWDADHFTNFNGFNILVYPVTPGQQVHLAGNFITGNYITAYFSDAALTNHIANGTKMGTASNQYYDYYETVPAGAHYMIVQQAMASRKPELPRIRLVENERFTQDCHKIVLLGDSYTQMAGHAASLMNTILAEHPEYDILNYGIGGEKSPEIMSRFGALQISITPDEQYLSTDDYGIKYIELPAAANSEIVIGGASALQNSWNSDGLNLRIQETTESDTNFRFCYINGILCRIERDNAASPYKIVRVNAATQSDKIYYGTKVIPINLIQLTNDDIFILNLGANGGYESIDELIEQVKQTIKYAGTDKYLVLSPHYADLGSGLSNGLANVLERDAKLAKCFGDKYISMHEYFLAEGVYDALASGMWNSGNYPTDVSGENHPDAADISAIENKTFAPMFRTNPNWADDRIHLSQRSYIIYYAKVYRRLVELGYFE